MKQKGFRNLPVLTITLLEIKKLAQTHLEKVEKVKIVLDLDWCVFCASDCTLRLKDLVSLCWCLFVPYLGLCWSEEPSREYRLAIRTPSSFPEQTSEGRQESRVTVMKPLMPDAWDTVSPEFWNGFGLKLNPFMVEGYMQVVLRQKSHLRKWIWFRLPSTFHINTQKTHVGSLGCLVSK